MKYLAIILLALSVSGCIVPVGHGGFHGDDRSWHR